MKMNRNNIIAIVILVLGGVWLASREPVRDAVFSKKGDTPSKVNENKGNKGDKKRPNLRPPKGNPHNPGSTSKGTNGVENGRWNLTAADLVNDPNLSDTDKQHLETLQDALDAENLDGVREAARHLMKSSSAGVRARTATALGWFGAAALPDLVAMFGDPSAEVMEAVMTPTLDAILEMDDGPEKAELVAALIATLTEKDNDTLHDALMLLTGIDDEIVIPLLEKLIRETKDPVIRDGLQEHLRFTKGD